MILLRLRATTRVTARSLSKSKKRDAASREPVSLTRPEAEEEAGEAAPSAAEAAALRSRTNRGRAMEARLQTAVSSAEVYSTISWSWFFFRRKNENEKKKIVVVVVVVVVEKRKTQ